MRLLLAVLVGFCSYAFISWTSQPVPTLCLSNSRRCCGVILVSATSASSLADSSSTPITVTARNVSDTTSGGTGESSDDDETDESEDEEEAEKKEDSCRVPNMIRTSLNESSRYPHFRDMTNMLASQGECKVPPAQKICKATPEFEQCCNKETEAHLLQFFNEKMCLFKAVISGSVLKDLTGPQGKLATAAKRLTGAASGAGGDLAKLYKAQAKMLDEIQKEVETYIASLHDGQLQAALEKFRYFISDMMCSVCDPKFSEGANVAGDTVVVKLDNEYFQKVQTALVKALTKPFENLGKVITKFIKKDGWLSKASQAKNKHFVELLNYVSKGLTTTSDEKIDTILQDVAKLSSTHEFLQDKKEKSRQVNKTISDEPVLMQMAARVQGNGVVDALPTSQRIPSLVVSQQPPQNNGQQQPVYDVGVQQGVQLLPPQQQPPQQLPPQQLPPQQVQPLQIPPEQVPQQQQLPTQQLQQQQQLLAQQLQLQQQQQEQLEKQQQLQQQQQRLQQQQAQQQLPQIQHHPQQPPSQQLSDLAPLDTSSNDFTQQRTALRGIAAHPESASLAHEAPAPTYSGAQVKTSVAVVKAPEAVQDTPGDMPKRPGEKPVGTITGTGGDSPAGEVPDLGELLGLKPSNASTPTTAAGAANMGVNTTSPATNVTSEGDPLAVPGLSVPGLTPGEAPVDASLARAAATARSAEVNATKASSKDTEIVKRKPMSHKRGGPKNGTATAKSRFTSCVRTMKFFDREKLKVDVKALTHAVENSMEELIGRQLFVSLGLGPQLCLYDLVVNTYAMLPDPRVDAEVRNKTVNEEGKFVDASDTTQSYSDMQKSVQKMMKELDELMRDQKTKRLGKDDVLILKDNEIVKAKKIPPSEGETAAEQLASLNVTSGGGKDTKETAEDTAKDTAKDTGKDAKVSKAEENSKIEETSAHVPPHPAAKASKSSSFGQLTGNAVPHSVKAGPVNGHTDRGRTKGSATHHAPLQCAHSQPTTWASFLTTTNETAPATTIVVMPIPNGPVPKSDASERVPSLFGAESAAVGLPGAKTAATLPLLVVCFLFA